jgi:hypothetical protein
MPARVDCVLPGLFDLPPGELSGEFLRYQLPHLNRVLSLARTRQNQAFNIDAIIRKTLDWEAHDDSTQTVTRCYGLPMAQAFAAPQAQDYSRYLLFQAIHLKPDLHSALILPLGNNQDNLNDIDILINDLKDMFKVDCDITAVASGVYLMRLHNFDAPLHYPHIISVLGKSANPYIEQSREIMPWYKLLNEMQMFLHQHEVNQKRLRSGLLPANSLWFWGGGRPEEIKQGLSWYCDEPLFNRFAQSLGLAPKSLDALDLSQPAGDSLVVDLRLLTALKSGQGESLDELLLDIDKRLFQPLLAAVNAGHSRLRLHLGYSLDFEMHPLSRFKFWKRRKCLVDWGINSSDF